MSAALSPTGVKLLAKHEATIAAHLKPFWEVADALTAIRDGRLYREHYDTFDAYCKNRWKFSARRARQLMAGSESGTTVPISNERQARALGPLKGNPEAQQEAVEAASQDGPPTAKKIAAEVAKRVPAKDTNKGGTDDDGSVSGSSEPESVPPPPPVIDTTSREVHVHRCECGAEWHDADLSVSA